MFVNVVSLLFFQTLTSDLRRGPGSRIEWAEGQHTFSFAAFVCFFVYIFLISSDLIYPKTILELVGVPVRSKNMSITSLKKGYIF